MTLPALIDNTTPVGTDSPAFGDDHLRNIKNFITSVFGIQNNVPYTGAAFAITPSGAVTVIQPTVTLLSATINAGVVTTDVSILNMNTTWSNPAVVFSAIKLNVTDTASAPGSLLLDLRRNGVMQFGVRKDGWVQALGLALTHPATPLVFGTGTTGTVQVAPLTAARTWTFPDASGTVLLTGSEGAGIVTGTWQGEVIAPAYGGTGLNTSTATGVPTIASGVWSVPAILPPSLGGTGGTAGAPSIPVPINQGGTNGTTQATARTNLDVFSTGEIQGGVALSGVADTAMLYANGKFLKGNNAGGTPRYIIGISSGVDEVSIGGDVANIHLWSTLIAEYVSSFRMNVIMDRRLEVAGGPDRIGILLTNDQWLCGKDTGGTTRFLIGLAANNALYVGGDGMVTHLGSASTATSIYGTTIALIGPTTVTGALTLTTPLAPASGGVPMGGTTGQVLAKNSTAHNDVAWVPPTSGPAGPAGPSGAAGATGPAGPGVPAGGTAGQVLTKASSTDFATVWAAGGTGGGGTVTDVLWTGPSAPADPTIELWADTDEMPTLDSPYAVRAWAGVTGATATITAQAGVTSVTRTGAGQYTVTLTIPMVVPFVAIVMPTDSNLQAGASTPTATTVVVTARNNAGALTEIDFSLIVCGNTA